MITADDIAAIYGADGKFSAEGFEGIRGKLTAAVAARRPFTMTRADYPRVYVTSDLHADLRKFTQILLSSGLVASVFDPDSDDIYDPRFISEIRWTAPPGTLLVIIGDLVDGKRSYNRGNPPYNQVSDPRGSFELLIFALLYNLRIQANTNGSEIRFTLGNHEVMSVIQPEIPPFGPPHFTQYVHDSAITFFTTPGMDWISRRQSAIMPFLELCPYYILALEDEVAFVHGGLHSQGAIVQSLAASLTAYQRELDSGTQRLAAVSPILRGERTSPIWTRFYARHAEGVCERLTDEYKFILVGHCPTTSDNARFKRIIATNALYANCDDGELIPQDGKWVEKVDRQLCVLLDCPAEREGDDVGAPRLGFVDTAMSACQHYPTWGPHQEIPHAPRSIQIMRLSHTEAHSIRYYNRIERIISPTGAAEVLYEVPVAAVPAAVPAAVAVGGRRATRSRRRKNRRTRFGVDSRRNLSSKKNKDVRNRQPTKQSLRSSISSTKLFS